MKPKIKKVGASKAQSFEIMEVNEPHFYSYWHFHPQLEIMYVLESTGTRIVGDSIKRFKPGEIVVLGPNLPHIWKNDNTYYHKATKKKAKAIVIYFDMDFLGKNLENIPEMYGLTDILKLSKQGLLLLNQTKNTVAGFLHDIVHFNGIDRIICLLNILKAIGQSKEYKVLSSKIYSSQVNEKDCNRINLIYQYSLDNFRECITLNDMSELSNMSPNAFCRYFKSMTGKTFIHFINELKIGEACRLIIENDMNFSQICYDVGFDNYSNFIRQFKKIKGLTPKEYKEKIRKTQLAVENIYER
jgi:AraC-like DNA-binding protein